ncbi:ciliary microtubule-associated protein 3 isoform a [Mus musculus]|uniref:Isoform 2 of Ciliary microtubule-associated protein 3 n=1 Tax=Mus musculus TaxID=10090 RepID=Q9D9W1-2|nr:ciliary microtubule-associated protein 3 isoform a [Mus musculus]AAH49757.1 1700027A23Rik protein [Mus musculus]ADI86275.1 pitchfork long isoform [Mus musculus]|eukprot:NP_001186957.1 protein pitchfork isoform a [Mus musculus]
MKTENEEDVKPPESCHAMQLLFKSLEASERAKVEEELKKTKENEFTQRNEHHALRDITHGKVNNYSFGTRQARKLFPHYHPPTWLGNLYLPLRGMPHTGPGCYAAATDWNGLAYNLSKVPTSTKGYAIGARTAVRFKPISKDVTPYPGMYQKVDTLSEKHKKSFAPFNILMPRFRSAAKGDSYPGPGTYNPEMKSVPKVTWPMKFGSPDWSQVPCLEKRTLKAELSADKDFRKHRSRVAYFSLYYQ